MGVLIIFQEFFFYRLRGFAPSGGGVLFLDFRGGLILGGGVHPHGGSWGLPPTFRHKSVKYLFYPQIIHPQKFASTPPLISASWSCGWWVVPHCMRNMCCMFFVFSLFTCVGWCVLCVVVCGCCVCLCVWLVGWFGGGGWVSSYFKERKGRLSLPQ